MNFARMDLEKNAALFGKSMLPFHTNEYKTLTSTEVFWQEYWVYRIFKFKQQE